MSLVACVGTVLFLLGCASLPAALVIALFVLKGAPYDWLLVSASVGALGLLCIVVGAVFVCAEAHASKF
ncbi:MAG: hypothetical protein KGL39_43025 [Patescibacteria group bacterium]|nr:hypothetical protein [Patescibacteria group bacterium]